MKEHSRGQILVVIPILVILMIGAILLTLNISIMCKEHIKTQTTADLSARSGAWIQSEGLSAITVINDVLLVMYGRMILDVGCLFATCWDPITWELCAECWEDLYDTYGNIKSLEKTANKIKKAIPSMVLGIVPTSALANGKYIGTCWPAKKSAVSLDLEWDFGWGHHSWSAKIVNWILNLFDLHGFLLRKHNSVKERVNVKVVKLNFKSIYGTAILGRGLTFPKITTFATAMPCWHLNHDPMNDKTGKWWSMMIPGFWWAPKMTRTKK